MDAEVDKVNAESRCRLCAADESINVDIFSVEGRSKKLADKIQTCLPLKVTYGDKLPKALCYRCMYLLEKFFDFRQCCLDTAQMLEISANVSASQTAKQQQPQQITIKQEVLSDSAAQDSMPTLEPQLQVIKKPSVSQLARASATASASKQKPAVSLLKIEADVIKVVDLTDKVVQARRSNGTKRQAHQSLLKESLLKSVDKRRHSSSSDAEDHLGQSEEEGGASRRKSAKPRKLARGEADGAKPFACMHCDKSFVLKNALSRHFNANHGSELALPPAQAVTPPVQNVTLVDDDQLEEDPGQTHYCEVCSRTFNDRGSLWLHLLYSHKQEAPLACGVCLQLSTSNEALMSHWRKHFPAGHSFDKRYSCQICGRQDNSRKKLCNHLRIHSLPSGVDLDSLVLSNSEHRADADVDDDLDFAPHEFADPSEAYHPCSLCFKAFESAETLAKHRRNVHKHVTCNVCQQAFDSEQQLMRHVTSEHFDGSHMLAEPFNPFEPLVDVATDTFYCPSCQASFDSAAGVERHQAMCKGASLTSADDFLHPCEVCSKSFVSEDCLVKHKKGAHKMDDSSTYSSYYFCEFCRSSHPTKSERWRHVNRFHADESTIRCDYEACGKIFVSPGMCTDHREHHRLQGDLPNTCELCGKLWNSRVEYWKHVQGVHADMLAHVCGICLKMFGETESMVYHVQTMHTLDANSFHCRVCARQYSNQSKCTRHEKIHRPAADCPVPLPEEVVVKKAVILNTPNVKKALQSSKEDALGPPMYARCEQCTKETHFATRELLAAHRRIQHALHPCDLCSKFYGRNSHLWKHVNKKHRGNPAITCAVCLKVSATSAQRVVHLRKMHRDEYRAEFPDDPCSDPETHRLQLHTCPQCNKVFSKSVTMKRHAAFCAKRTGRTLHSSGAACERCTETFPSRASLLSHAQSVHPELRCDKCAVFVRSAADLATHLAQHDSMENPLYCETCGEVCSAPARLWSHMMCHHKGLVPTMCGVCYRALADTAALRAHVDKEHPGATSRELACRVCAKHYSSVYKVVDHVTRYHVGWLTCRDCLAVFESAVDLRAHAVREHGLDHVASDSSSDKTPSLVVKNEADESCENMEADESGLEEEDEEDDDTELESMPVLQPNHPPSLLTPSVSIELVGSPASMPRLVRSEGGDCLVKLESALDKLEAENKPGE